MKANLKLKKVDRRTREYQDAAMREELGKYLDEQWEKGGAQEQTRHNLALGELIVQLQQQETDYLVDLAAAFEKRERPTQQRAAIDLGELARLGDETAVRLEAIGCIIAIVAAWSHRNGTQDAVHDLLRVLTNPDGLRLVSDDDQTAGSGSPGPGAGGAA